MTRRGGLPLFIRLLIVLATSFLTVALAGIPSSAAIEVRGLFLVLALAAAGLAVLWDSRGFRSRFPIKRPFVMRMHELWREVNAMLEGGTYREADGYRRMAELDNRVWAAFAREMPERAAVIEAAAGGRLQPDHPALSAQDLYQRLRVLQATLVHLIEEEG